MIAVLQFDSTSVPVVERMLGEGKLPTLARLRAWGHAIELDPGTTPVFPSAAYPTLYTGTEVSDHGLYSAFPWFPDEQRVRFMRSLPRPRSVWERLGKDRRSLVVDP